MLNEIEMSWKEFEDAIRELAQKIKHSNIKISNIYGEPRGGLIPAVRLSHLLGVPLITELAFIDRNTLIVDEIIDSGKTLKYASQNWKIAVIYYNSMSEVIPDFYVLKRYAGEWIVFPWELK